MSRGPEFSAVAFDEHLKQLKRNYGHQAIVNLLGSSLVGSKEGEATLSTAYQTHHKNWDHHLDVPHILFDYHAEMKGGSAKNLDALKNKVHKYVDKFGFFTQKGTHVSRYVPEIFLSLACFENFLVSGSSTAPYAPTAPTAWTAPTPSRPTLDRRCWATSCWTWASTTSPTSSRASRRCSSRCGSTMATS